MLGKEVRLPAELMFGSVFNGQNRIETYGEYVEILKERMLRAHSVARKHLQAAAKRQKENYDAKLSFQIYQPGQPVWLLNEARQEGRCPKLQNHYQGPFLILKRITKALGVKSRNPNKVFPKTFKPTLPKYTATPIPIAPKLLAPLETSTATCTAASIDSYTRLLQSNMPCLSMPAFSTYSVAQTAPSPYCPPVIPVASSRKQTTVTKFVLESPVTSCILNMETPKETLSSMPVQPLDQFQFDLEDNLDCGSWKSPASVSSQSVADEAECPEDIITTNDNNIDQNNNHIDLTVSSSVPEVQMSDVPIVGPIVQ
ncbi:unnamed protein product [Mytilus coruscus]|uniref:Uncharacterized protein n=1 Tax=Mytilus coruscus TaxID=42192 RepID=A0A6J8C8Q2_MYTCO|nr:unnamed protein product [Mytilus coruscus]